jgi:glutaredoxin-like protein
MSVLSTEIADQVKQELADLTNPVRMVMFTQTSECQYCDETKQLVEEVAALSEQVTTEIYDLTIDTEKAQDLGIDKTPAIAIIGAEDYGVRFYGIPAGYEFVSLLHALKLVAAGKPELTQESLETLAEAKDPIHIQVFVTPTCPYCQHSVMLSHQMAVASPLVQADMVEATEFPQLSHKYQVMGVPRTVINETTHIEGAAQEAAVMEKLRQALTLPEVA